MKYHYKTGIKKRWSFGSCLAVVGWTLLLLLIIDSLLFNNQLLTKALSL